MYCSAFPPEHTQCMRERFAVTQRILSWESDGGPEKGPLMLDVSMLDVTQCTLITMYDFTHFKHEFLYAKTDKIKRSIKKIIDISVFAF